MKLTFYNPSFKGGSDFGAATLGFAGSEDAEKYIAKTFEYDIDSVVVTGTYGDILANVPDVDFQAVIVLLGNGGNENEFVRKLRSAAGAPLVGGSAAICSATGESALVTGRGQAAVMYVCDNRFDVTVVSQNVHSDILGECTLSFDGRYIETIDGQNALEWYRNKQKEYNLQENDFEHLTIADCYGINAHLSVRDGRLFSGRDLDEKMVIRYLAPDKAQERIQEFYDEDDAIVFGCAGLKQTLTDSITTSALGLFMFGEVCTVGERSDFGNLMLSKIIFRPKK